MLMTLILKELRLLGRDLHGLAVLLAMPTAFILIMSLAMQDAFGGLPRLSVHIDNRDEGAFGAATSDALLAQEGVASEPSGQADFLLVIPSDFSERLFDAPDAEDAPLLEWHGRASVLPQARAAFSAALRGAVLRTQGDALIDTLEAEQGGDFTRLREIMTPQRWNIRSGVVGSEQEPPSSVEQSVPAWLVFAMFFVVVPLSTVMLIEREQGTAMRLRALRVPAATQLLARIPAYYLVNMLQMVAMLAVGAWLVPALGGQGLTLSGSGWALWIAGSATSLAAISLALLVAVIARSGMQAIALGASINLVFGAIGGIMVPKMVMPVLMQPITALSPMSWALEAFWGAMLRDSGALATLFSCLPLLGFGALLLIAAAVLQSRSEEWTP